MAYPEIANFSYNRNNLRWDGWGAQDQDFFYPALLPRIIDLVRAEVGAAHFEQLSGYAMEEIKIKPVRLRRADLNELEKIVGKANVKTDRQERIFHSLGKSYYDAIRIKLNAIPEAVDAVVYPGDENAVVRILQLALRKKWAVIPFGGGTSVVGGIEAFRRKHPAILSLDMTRFNKIIKIDTENMVVSAQAGIYGPELERALQEKGLTVSHFPQSFEYATVGGWVAARGAGQQSNRYGKIEDLLYSARMVLPGAVLQTDALPAGSTGPVLNSLILGNEGSLGVITEATLRIHEVPARRLYRAFLFKEFQQALEFVKKMTRMGLPEVAMLRLSDPEESRLFGLLGRLRNESSWKGRLKQRLQDGFLFFEGMRQHCLVIAGLEGDHDDVALSDLKLRNTAREFRGLNAGESAGHSWLKGRFNMPFLRNHLIPAGIGVDTFETTITFSKLIELRAQVYEAFSKTCKHGRIMAHISHSYPEGACIYFTMFFSIKQPAIQQWQKLKNAVSDAVIKAGGNISHHHGVGRDHIKWFKAGNPEVFSAVKKIKEEFDPAKILNPGKLVE